MNNAFLQEPRQMAMIDLFKDLVQSKIPVDAWLDSMPEDIDNWKIDYELTDHIGKTEYRCLTRFYDLEDDYIVNAVIETRPIHE